MPKFQPIGNYPPLYTPDFPVSETPDASAIMQMQRQRAEMQRQQQMDKMRQLEREEAKRQDDLSTLLRAAQHGDPKMVTDIANALRIDSSLVPVGVDFAKTIRAKQKQEEEAATAAQLRGERQKIIPELAKGFAGRLSDPRANREDVRLEALQGLAGLPGVTQETLGPEYEQLLSLGYAQRAAQEGKQRREVSTARQKAQIQQQYAKGTEYERLLREEETGKDIAGRPTSPWRMEKIKVRRQQLEQGEQEEGTLIIGPNGETIATGKGIAHSERIKLENQYVDQSMFVYDLEDAISLIEEDFKRAGIWGTATRGAQSAVQILNESASAMTSEAIDRFSQNVQQQLEQDVESGRADPSILTMAESVVSDTAHAKLQTLSFYITYGIAREERGAGRLNAKDLERAEKSFGITGATSAERALNRLRYTVKRAKRRKDITEKRMERIGMVTIRPSDMPQRPEQRPAGSAADEFMRRHGLGPYAPGVQGGGP